MIKDSDLSNDHLVCRLLPWLELLSNQEDHIEKANISALHELALNFIYKNPIPSENDKFELKTHLLEKIGEIRDENLKQFFTEITNFALEDPYSTYKNLKSQYPLWFSESLIYFWDISGSLNTESFKIFPEQPEDLSTTMVEYVTGEYIQYIIEKQ